MHLVLQEKCRQMVTKTAQRMMVHIWATRKAHLSVHREDGHEILVPEEDHGIADCEEPEWKPRGSCRLGAGCCPGQALALRLWRGGCALQPGAARKVMRAEWQRLRQLGRRQCIGAVFREEVRRRLLSRNRKLITLAD